MHFADAIASRRTDSRLLRKTAPLLLASTSLTLALGHGASAADIDLDGGTYTVSTSQSTTGAVNIGATANTTVTIATGGDLQGEGGVNIAAQATGQATVTIDGGALVGGPDGDIIIGGLGTAEVTVQNGGTLTTNFASTYVGVNAGGSGTVTVTGATSTWSTGDLVLGDLGQGSATITDDATLTVSGDTVIGNVTGSEGSLTISDGGTADTYEAFIGYGAGSTGTATVTGTDSYWSTHGSIAYVGYDGTGSLTVTDGGEFTTSGDYLYLGSNTGSDGTLTISGGGTVSTGIAFVGNASGSTGAATVTGPGSSWTTSGNAYVGGSGTGSLTVTDEAEFTTSGGTLVVGSNSGAIGTLTISDGGTATIDGDTAIGDFAGSTGSATVTGSGSSLDTQNLYVGKTGTGTLLIEADADVTAGIVYLGYSSVDADGTLTVTGAGSTLDSDELHVGYNSALTIANGANVMADTVGIDDTAGSGATATVTGAGSSLVTSTYLIVGGDGTGTLTTADGADVQSSDYFIIGNNLSSEGTVTVTGDGSTLETEVAYIGYSGAGALVIEDGAHATSLLTILGNDADGEGTVTVTGEGSTWEIGSLGAAIGYAGTGTLTVADGATVTMDSGNGMIGIASQSGSTGTLNIGASSGETAVAAGTIDAATITFGSGTGTLVFNHTDDDYQFDTAIVGGGTLEAYSGTTLLSGDLSSFTGDTEIHGGTLSFNTTYSGAISVLSGGTLGGNGTLSNVTLSSGATVAPGNSIGTLNIAGDLDFVSGTTYAVEVNDAGSVAGTNNDLLHATGTVYLDSGATVAVSAENGTDNGSTYVSGTTYTILTADTLVSGTFGSVTDDFAFLDGALTYDVNNVYLTLNQSTHDFSAAVTAPNQVATANAVETLSSGNDVYNAVLGLTTDETAAAFAALSGELHANVDSARLSRSGMSRDVITNRIRDAFSNAGSRYSGVAAYGEGDIGHLPTVDEKSQVWMSGFGSWTSLDGDGNALGSTASGGGLLFGLDRPLGDGWRLGALAGYGQDSVASDETDADATVDSYYLGLYGGRSLGPLQLRFGALHAFQEIDSARHVALGGFTDDLTADYHGSTSQAFIEGAWRFDRDLLHIEPFANLAYVHGHTDAFAETGGAAALSKEANDENQLVSTLGVRIDRDIAWQGMLGKLSAGLGWRHTFGDMTSDATLAFAGSDSFTVSSAAGDRDTGFVNLGVSFDLSENANLAVGYSGQFGSDTTDHRANAKLDVSF